MRVFRSSWRPPVFWFLGSLVVLFLAAQLSSRQDLPLKYRELYAVLTRGDLTLFQESGFLKQLGLLIVYAGLAATVLIVFISRVLRSLYLWASSRYTLGAEKVSARHGLIARDYREGYRSDLRNLHIRQSLLDRLLGTGDVSLSSAGFEGLAVHWRKVSGPFKLRRELAMPMGMEKPAPTQAPIVEPTRTSLLEAQLFNSEEPTSPAA